METKIIDSKFKLVKACVKCSWIEHPPIAYYGLWPITPDICPDCGNDLINIRARFTIKETKGWWDEYKEVISVEFFTKDKTIKK